MGQSERTHRMSGSKVVLVTGASSGIGQATALELIKAGYTVYGGARRVDAMAPLVDAGGKALSLDVTDDASMVAAVDAIIAAEGKIDALVNNAGYGSYGAVEDVPMNEGRRQLEVNVFGLARMTQLVLPHMREARSGRIINISSIGGTVWTPLGAWYHGTKWFVEGFTNAMRFEVEPFGIKMIIVAPGLIDTGFSGGVADTLGKTSMEGPYSELAGKLSASSNDPSSWSQPVVIAKAIRQALGDRKPKTLYRAGAMSRLLPFLARTLPNRWFDRLVMSQLR